MSKSIQRAIADWICSASRAMLPGHLRDWADALRSETAHIPHDGDALRFAAGSLCGLLPRALMAHFKTAFAAPPANPKPPGEWTAMSLLRECFRRPRIAGAVCAATAACLGLAYLAAAGAPATYLIMNLAALLIGMGLLSVSAFAPHVTTRWSGAGTLAMATVLLATSLFGSSVEGAARWVAVGPLFVQTSLLFLPLIIVGFSRTRTFCATAGMAVAALALALQPDRAMAGVMVAGLAAMVALRFDIRVGLALAGAVLAFMATLTQPDTLPAVPYVDQILYSAFGVHPLAGAAVLAGAAMLLVPAIVGWRTNAAGRLPAAVFGAVWFAIILAAALGNYPTPVVGYGSSAIIGYLLSLTALPAAAKRASAAEAENASAQDPGRPGGLGRSQILSVLGLALFGLSSAASQEAPDDCTRTRAEKVEVPNTVWQPGPGGKQIPLWPEDVDLQLPDYGGNPEMTGTGSPLIAGRTWGWATYISRPTMTVYPPAGENSGAAMLVLPGGGYAAVAMDLEGTEICDWITQHGVTCIILKYRTPQVWRRDENGVGIPPDDLFALEDAQRAMSLLRDRAASYNIDPDEIGVIGFSAGAHLAAALSNAGDRSYEPVDAADLLPMRPDYAIVVYPGRFLPKRNPGTDLSLAPWVEVTAGAPPTLLIHAMNDSVNDVRHSMAYGLALHDMGVPVDMRFFARGCHAFGLRHTSDPVTTEWPTHAVQWLKHIGML